MATIKKSVSKAQGGKNLKPTYKNLRLGVANTRREAGQPTRDGYGASKQDSALYRFGFGRGVKGEKEYPGEPPIQKMGRWEGQNAAKASKTSSKKMKTGGKIVKKAKSGSSFPDLNKDGKITKKDILIGKGVLPKTAKKGNKVKKGLFGLESIFGGNRDRNKPTIKIKVKGRNNSIGNIPGMMRRGGKTKKK
jgi:hypothetical protein